MFKSRNNNNSQKPSKKYLGKSTNKIRETYELKVEETLPAINDQSKSFNEEAGKVPKSHSNSILGD
jgi:hypothetical protein